MTASPRRRWFRFSLRTLFVLVAVLGLSLVWLGMQLKWIRERSEARQWIDQHTSRMLHFGDCKENERPFPIGLRLLGEREVREIWLAESTMSNDDLEHVKRIAKLFPEARVSVGPP